MLCAAILGPLALEARTGRLHQSIVDRLNAAELSGEIHFEINQHNSWLAFAGLESVFTRIECVTIRKANQEDIDLVLDEITQLGQLDQVTFERCIVSTEQLERLLKNTSISYLYVGGLDMQSDRMPFLRDTNLLFLTIQDSQFGNAAIDDLPDSLLHFSVSRCQIDDRGLPKLTRLKQLRRFHIWIAPATPDGCRRLAEEMPNTFIEFCLAEDCASPRILPAADSLKPWE